MISRRMLSAVAVWLILLSFVCPCQCKVVEVYPTQKLEKERARLEKAARGLWQLMYDKLLKPQEQAALRLTQSRFPLRSSDGNAINFIARLDRGTVELPIQSLLLLEDVCTAYAWLYYKGYSAITINEYASMLKYRRSGDFPRGECPPPLKALGIPADALSDKRVDALSLRFRNSAFAHVIAHEMGHHLYQHPGNRAVPADVSRAHEREADAFALRVLRRDEQIPMGAILYFQLTAFIASPGRWDYPSVEAWRKALRKYTHPVTSDRVSALAASLRSGADGYGANRKAALDVAVRLDTVAKEMDDRDWQRYFYLVGQRAGLARLRPRKK